MTNKKKKKIDDGIIDKGTKSLWNNFGQRVQRSSVSQKKKCCRDAMENLKLNLSNHIFLYSFSLKIRFSLFYIFRLLFFPSNHFHNFFNFDASSLTRRIFGSFKALLFLLCLHRFYRFFVTHDNMKNVIKNMKNVI